MITARNMPLMVVCLSLLSSRAIPQKNKMVSVWTSALSHVAETQVAWEEVENQPNHSVAVSYLRDDSPTEIHASQAEILVARDGDATLVIYGAISEPKNMNASVAEQVHLTKGDIVEIPPNLEHQLKIAPGKFFIYTSIRIKSH